METDHQTRVAVAGRESMECLRLADVLREVIGRENVFRYLETEHLLKFLEKHSQIPIVVFVDIFSFDLQEVTHDDRRNPGSVSESYVQPLYGSG